MFSRNTSTEPRGPPQQIVFKTREDSKKKSSNSPILRPVRYRKLASCLLLCYVAVLLIPWVVTCVTMVRPLNARSYEEQGMGLSIGVLDNILLGIDVIGVFEKIQNVIAIPIVSGFLARAAVVYAQRRSDSRKQKLSVRQLIALADRPWGSIPGLYECVSSKVANRFIVFGGLLILLVAATPAIQSLLVKYETYNAAFCAFMPTYGCNAVNIPAIIGLDPEPYDMQQMPQNLAVQYVSKKTQMVSMLDLQPYLWPEAWKNIDDANGVERGNFFWYNYFLNTPTPDQRFFVSALLNGTNTGVLREHAVRLSSSSSCEPVSQAQFPQNCPGERSFITNFSANNTIDIRICAPGAYGKTPWTLSRDRQDITEELWIDVVVYGLETLYVDGLAAVNFTQYCTANSTRGYFEVNNELNGNAPGPVLEKWPSVEELMKDYNDYLGVAGDFAIPSTINNYTTDFMLFHSPQDPFNVEKLYAAGPLMTSALALFGNTSFFYTAKNANESTANLLCLAYSFSINLVDTVCGYLSTYSESETTNLISYLLYNWISMFNDNTTGPAALDIAMYFANEAVLTSTAAQGSASTSRSIYYSSGIMLLKPQWSLKAIITMSILIGIQVLSLCFLVAYIYSVPTWTENLDGFAMVRIGAELQRMKRADFAGIRDTDKEDFKDLNKLDGVIGVEKDYDFVEQQGPRPRCGDLHSQIPADGADSGEVYPLISVSSPNDDASSTSIGPSVANNDDDISQQRLCQLKQDEVRDTRALREGLMPPFRLAVGAPGPITRNLASRSPSKQIVEEYS